MKTKDRYFIAHFGSGLTLAEGEALTYYLSPLYDAGERGNRWQRILLDAFFPEDTRITCRVYAVDRAFEAQTLKAVTRAPDKSLMEKQAALEVFKKFEIDNATDFLLPGVTGRYLMVGLTLSKQGSAPPVLSHMRVYAEQESFLGYLPEIFQDEGGFLDRFLRLFSVQYLTLEEKIERLPQWFDPRSAPPEMLPWLAGIMGIPYAALWDADGLRKLLSARVYARKGTLSGLRELLAFYTGRMPQIVEGFRMQTGHAEQDDLYAGCRLTVLLPAGSLNESRTAETVDLLVKTYLPKEIGFALVPLEDRAVLSGYSYLDVNACLSDYSAAVLDADSRLGNAALGG